MKKSLIEILTRQFPEACASIRGSRKFSDIRGCVYFYEVEDGVLVLAQVMGLPYTKEECKNEIFAFHIHEGKRCTGTREDPFSDTKAHYNPDNCTHPNHEGDLPPLFGNHGFALSCFYTENFEIDDIIGKTIIIHQNPDDFTTQPSGNAGTKIACGEIRKVSERISYT